jgi:hypothetical protein
MAPSLRVNSFIEKIRALDEAKLSALEKYLHLIELDEVSEEEIAYGATEIWKQSRSFDFLADSEIYTLEDAVARYNH